MANPIKFRHPTKNLPKPIGLREIARNFLNFAYGAPATTLKNALPDSIEIVADVLSVVVWFVH